MLRDFAVKPTETRPFSQPDGLFERLPSQVTEGSLLATKRSKQGIRAVAARAGVSTASVSRAINSPESVLRARIARAIEAVGYAPRAPTALLSSKCSRTLGRPSCIMKWTTPLFSESRRPHLRLSERN
ncbi:MAG: LacI family DNA-binding transcriptional regulator [Methylobacteriaceae bacterium]|nr:LacI family DNA-binding transcriptional regulator [Methylobacteriaceae bacterium]